MTLFGREAHLPAGQFEWLELLAILAIIAVTMLVVSGWSTVLLGISVGFASYLYDHQIFIPVVIAVAGTIAFALGVRAGQAPAGWRAAKEAALLAAGFVIYEWGRTQVIGSFDRADANAQRIMAFERRIGLAIEEPLQKFVVRHETLVERFNWIYSFAFLSFVIAAIFYLYVSNERLYRVYRTSLGISALLALVTIALIPTAPPRLAIDSGMLSTHELVGKAHGFVNPYAAMPSLHVGWVALAGFMLSRATRGPARWFWATVPVTVMTLTVMSTGNHYWMDGAVGAAFGIVPAMLLLRRETAAEAQDMATSGVPVSARIRLPNLMPAENKTRFSLLSLGSLLAYLLIRQAVDPGFTDYWGYMVGQISLTLLIVLWVDDQLGPWGGFSWFTHLVIVINTWADSLGTAGHMYSKYVEYDKITHFLGGVMLTAAAADIIFAIQKRRNADVQPLRILTWAICISVGMGAAWELYEYYGDILFNTGRHAGAIDTSYDLVSDSVGSMVGAAMLWRWKFSAYDRDQQVSPSVPRTQ
jgi:hypothetical protein